MKDQLIDLLTDAIEERATMLLLRVMCELLPFEPVYISQKYVGGHVDGIAVGDVILWEHDDDDRSCWSASNRYGEDTVFIESVRDLWSALALDSRNLLDVAGDYATWANSRSPSSFSSSSELRVLQRAFLAGHTVHTPLSENGRRVDGVVRTSAAWFALHDVVA